MPRQWWTVLFAVAIACGTGADDAPSGSVGPGGAGGSAGEGGSGGVGGTGGGAGGEGAGGTGGGEGGSGGFDPTQPEEGEDRPGGDLSVLGRGALAFTRPGANLTLERRSSFTVGEGLFQAEWLATPVEQSNRGGLGPLFHARSCLGCHVRNGRGAAPAPGADHPASLLVRLGNAGAPHPVYGDQLQPLGVAGVPGEGRVLVEYQPIEGSFSDGAPFTLHAPSVRVADLSAGPLGDAPLSPRIAQPMIGLGLLAAIPDEAMEALADPDDRDGDGISGRVNRVWSERLGGMVAGRFGWKANQPDLEQQNAAALVGDLGLTSPLYPAEPCTPAQTECLAARSKTIEIDERKLAALTYYTHTIGVPIRDRAEDADVLRGKAIFHRIACAKCHVPSFTTRDVVGLPEVSGQRIFPYTDLLLHDLGEGLADGRPDFEASGREWRTPPLWGLGLAAEVDGAVRLLHDGRAQSIEEAILWHGGEAEASREAFRTLPAEERRALVDFLESL